MSERTGSTRDARHLSGADIGRTISVTIGGGYWSGPLYEVIHKRFEVNVSIGDGWGEAIIDLHPTDAVTITGAE